MPVEPSACDHRCRAYLALSMLGCWRLQDSTGWLPENKTKQNDVPPTHFTPHLSAVTNRADPPDENDDRRVGYHSVASTSVRHTEYEESFFAPF